MISPSNPSLEQVKEELEGGVATIGGADAGGDCWDVTATDS